MNAPKEEIVIVTQNGWGKRTIPSNNTAITITKKTGPIVLQQKITKETKSISITTKTGKALILDIKSIPLLGYLTQGIRIIKLAEKDEVTNVFIN